LDSEQYIELIDKASKLINDKELDEAENILQKLFPKTDSEQKIIVINNLASIAYQRGDTTQALALLEPYLQAESPVDSPYTFGLAAQLYACIDRRDEAKRCLNRAVKSFEKALSYFQEQNINPQSWYEYTVQLMRAAGALADHRRVIDLYKKYERYHVSWENRFHAGIAYFNLKRYKQAASIWDPLNKIGSFIVPMQRVAFLMERDVVPQFELSYKTLDWDGVIKKFRDAGDSKEKQEEALEDGLIRIVLLDTLFDEQLGEGEKKNAVKILVSFGREWGKELGQRLLESALVPTEVKMEVVFALVERGVYAEDEQVPVWIDGKETLVRVEKKELSLESDQELDQLCDRALELRNKGQIDEAITLLEPLYREGNFYPRAMITLANLYRNKKEWEPALNILEILAEAFPDEPVIMVNLAGLYVETGAFDQALQCITRIEEEEMGGNIRGRLDYIRSMAEQRLTPDEYVDHLDDSYLHQLGESLRLEVEEKKFTPRFTLNRGLKNMPNEWLLNICAVHDIETHRHRPQREKAITAYLTNPAHLKKAAHELTKPEQELLIYLLGKEGWALLSAVSRKFGKMEGDGFYWDEEKPQSTTGRLWSKGLIMVGKTILNDRLVKIAAIPIDLRPLLENIFSSDRL